MTMKIIIAPDSFKESMSALEAASAIEAGFKKSIPKADYIKIPMADGGEGTVQSLVDATGGRILKELVTGPLGESVEAFYGITGDGKTAVIEMAAASGLHLIQKEERNPLYTTTRGTGELILAALHDDVEQIIIGIGGSATTDGGAGMAQALGAKLLDSSGTQIGYGGIALEKLHSIDLKRLDKRLLDVEINIACDVDNPLTGEHGAAAVFGPQKGATPKIVAVLDENLSHYGEVVKKELGKDISTIPGAGAAGGLGAGLIAFLDGDLRRGVDVVIETVQLELAMENASLVITGEGKIDNQTAYGKTPLGVAKVAKKFGVPVIGIAGMVDYCVEDNHGLDAVFSIVPGPISSSEAMERAEKYTEALAKNIAELIQIGNL